MYHQTAAGGYHHIAADVYYHHPITDVPEQMMFVSDLRDPVPVSQAETYWSMGCYLYSLSGTPLRPFIMTENFNADPESDNTPPFVVICTDGVHPVFGSSAANCGPWYRANKLPDQQQQEQVYNWLKHGYQNLQHQLRDHVQRQGPLQQQKPQRQQQLHFQQKLPHYVSDDTRGNNNRRSRQNGPDGEGRRQIFNETNT